MDVMYIIICVYIERGRERKQQKSRCQIGSNSIGREWGKAMFVRKVNCVREKIGFINFYDHFNFSNTHTYSVS